MSDTVNFDRLASSLTLDERKSLLDKLKSQSKISQEPLYAVEKEQGTILDIDELFFRLPWYSRLMYKFLSFLKSKAPGKLYEERHVVKLGRRILKKYPGLYDYQRGNLLPEFYNQLQNLKTASRFFYTALDASFNKEKGAFYAFLGSLEMPDIHVRLQSAASPEILEATGSDADIRSVTLRAMDEALKGISDEQRRAMYNNARSLFCLKELSSYLFDRLIVNFKYDTSFSGYICNAFSVRDMLTSLNNMLFSLKYIPPMPLMESLFIFILQEKAEESDFNINKEAQGLLARTEEALTVIRKFNAQVPLSMILFCTGRNSRPQEISGGEDWFLLYREYWKRQIDDNLAQYAQDRRRRGLEESFRDFIKTPNLERLTYTSSDPDSEGFDLKGSFGLSFLLAFYNNVFIPDINAYLRLIIMDGEFARKESRIEYTEIYNGIFQAEERIRKLENDISPIGTYGQRIAQAKQDMTSLQVKRRKTQLISDEASKEALTILEETRRGCRNMIDVLNSIANKETKGTNYSLANLPELLEKDGNLVDNLKAGIKKFKKAIEILDDIEALEAGRPI